MDRDACTCRLKQHLGFAQPTNPLRLLTPGGLAMASPFVHFTEKEVQLLTRWRAEGKSVGEGRFFLR